MVQVLIVHCHPEPQSFNGSMTRTAVNVLEGEGHRVRVTYMSSEQFELHLKESLDKWGGHLKNLDQVKPLRFPGWEDWDDGGVEKRA